MATVYGASSVSLHVRKSNRAALGLYKDTLGFNVEGIENKYCEIPLCRPTFQHPDNACTGDRCGRRGCLLNAIATEFQ